MEVFRSTLCPKCGGELKICKNCRFYCPGAQWDCRETIPEGVSDKERANFCSYFKYKEGGPENGGGENTKKDEAKKKFDQLFGS